MYDLGVVRRIYWNWEGGAEIRQFRSEYKTNPTKPTLMNSVALASNMIYDIGMANIGTGNYPVKTSFAN